MTSARRPLLRLVTPKNSSGTTGTFLVLALAGVAHAQSTEPSDEAAIEVSDETIVVTGTRAETPRQASPVTTEVIDRARLAESGVQTAAEALSLRPGLWIDRGVAGTSGLTMLGLGPQYSLVLVDGARQIGRTDGVLDLDRFAVEDIEQIEIVRGPSSVLYGSDALAGVVNFVSRTPKEGVAVDALGRVDGRLGYEMRGRVAAGRGDWGGSLTGTYREAPAIHIGDAVGTPATSFAAYADRHVTARGVHNRGDAWRFDAVADYLQRDLRSVDAGATGAILDRHNRVDVVMSQLIARWSDEVTAVRLEADASVYRDQFLSDQRMSEALDQYQLTDENLIEARGQIARTIGAHQALVGAEVLREELSSARLSSTGDRVRAAVFAQDTWRADEAGRIVVVPAARVDADTQFGTNATPRLAARAQLSEDAVVRGSLGMGYRAPSFKEMLLLFSNPGAGYIVEGNPELSPETSVSVQVGGEWQATSWLWLGADTYLNRLREMIVAVARGGADDMLRYSYDNIGRVRTMGAEAYAVAGRGRAAIELGYALNRSRDLDEDRALANVPLHRVTATLRWRDKPQKLDAFAAFVITGARPLYINADPQDATWTPRRFEIRARVSKRFSSGVGGFMGIDNLLNTGDARLDPVYPRTLYAGLELHR